MIPWSLYEIVENWANPNLTVTGEPTVNLAISLYPKSGQNGQFLWKCGVQYIYIKEKDLNFEKVITYEATVGFHHSRWGDIELKGKIMRGSKEQTLLWQ